MTGFACWSDRLTFSDNFPCSDCVIFATAPVLPLNTRISREANGLVSVFAEVSACSIEWWIASNCAL